MSKSSPALCATTSRFCKPDHAATVAPAVISACPRGQALSAAGVCEFRAPPGGYWCVDFAGVFACGGVGQPADPCATARTFIPDATCLVDPYLADIVPLPACNDGTIGLVVAVLTAWLCP